MTRQQVIGHGVTNRGMAIRSQFPLKPSGASSIHQCQGSSFGNVCIDMSLSGSNYRPQDQHFARGHFSHAHYVAASRATSLEGLQILNWNPDFINVDENVKKVVEHMHEKRQVQLSFKPVYAMGGDYKCCFLNTRSLHLHQADIAASFQLKAADVFMLAETRLQENDVDGHYKVDGFNCVVRNDGPHVGGQRPHHGMIAYVKDGVRLLEQKVYSSRHFEAIVTCVLKEGYVTPLQVIGMYVSPQASWEMLATGLSEIFREIDIVSTETVIMGDFNMKSVSRKKDGYNDPLERYMRGQWNMDQHCHESTTKEGSVLDLVFAKQVNEVTTVWNYWSDHRIVGVSLVKI